MRKELAAITGEAELKTANPDVFNDGAWAKAAAPDVMPKGVLVWSLVLELCVTVSMNGSTATGGPPVLSDGEFTSGGAVAAGRKSARGKGTCNNCAGTAIGGVGEVTGVAAATVVALEFVAPLPFLVAGSPSRGFPETLFGRCKISCTSPANDSAGADDVGFTATGPEGAAATDDTDKMLGLELETGCILGG